jgi:hydroxymethylpyrimidine/phosphomethylpyrimidine kinase
VLCIGGLDPAGRAGLLADARAVAAMGARPLCVATALTFQSSVRVDGYEAVSCKTLQSQLRTLIRDEQIDAVKIGQLATAENAAVVAELPLQVPMVLDTPLVSSSGAELFPAAAVIKAYRPLVARATVVTPNAEEVFLLTGRERENSRAAAEYAAVALGAEAVLLKGGHLEGDRVVDVLIRGSDRSEFSSHRLRGRFRGTGCRLASAMAAALASGDTIDSAVMRARLWLVTQLRSES